MERRSTEQRLLDFCSPEPMSGCWLWTGQIDKRYGYGRIKLQGRAREAYRVSYETFVGPVPEGLELDHKCRVRSCVNPAHLEPVTRRENQLRGFSVSGICARKTHCSHGHEFNDANTYRKGTTRTCRACRALRRRLQRQQESEE